MSAEKDVVVHITVDTSKFEAAVESLRIRTVRLRERYFGLAPDDISRRFPSCSVNHEDYFTGRGAYSVDKTNSDELWTCPGCGAAL